MLDPACRNTCKVACDFDTIDFSITFTKFPAAVKIKEIQDLAEMVEHFFAKYLLNFWSLKHSSTDSKD